MDGAARMPTEQRYPIRTRNDRSRSKALRLSNGGPSGVDETSSRQTSSLDKLFLAALSDSNAERWLIPISADDAEPDSDRAASFAPAAGKTLPSCTEVNGEVH
jgi:hypothetical protein